MVETNNGLKNESVLYNDSDWDKPTNLNSTIAITTSKS